MPLDDEEKKALKEKYREHRESIWFGKSSKRKKGKKEKYSNNKGIKPETFDDAPKQRGEFENSISSESLEEQNQMVILHRSKNRYVEHPDLSRPDYRDKPRRGEDGADKPRAEEISIPEIGMNSKRSGPKVPRKPSVKSYFSDDEETVLEQTESEAKFAVPPDEATTKTSDSSVVELSRQKRTSKTTGNLIEQYRAQSKVKLDRVPKTEAVTKPSPSSSEINNLKDKIKNQRQDIWLGISSQKKQRPKLKKRKVEEAEEGFEQFTLKQNSQVEHLDQPVPQTSRQAGKDEDEKKGLTWGIAFAVIFGIVAAIVLGVLLGYLLTT